MFSNKSFFFSVYLGINKLRLDISVKLFSLLEYQNVIWSVTLRFFFCSFHFVGIIGPFSRASVALFKCWNNMKVRRMLANGFHSMIKGWAMFELFIENLYREVWRSIYLLFFILFFIYFSDGFYTQPKFTDHLCWYN